MGFLLGLLLVAFLVAINIFVGWLAVWIVMGISNTFDFGWNISTGLTGYFFIGLGLMFISWITGR